MTNPRLSAKNQKTLNPIYHYLTQWRANLSALTQKISAHRRPGHKGKTPAFSLLIILLCFLLTSCMEVQLENSLALLDGATLEQGFGQLREDENSTRITWYTRINIDPEDETLMAISTGRIQYFSDLDGLSECRVLSPKKREGGISFDGLDQVLTRQITTLKIAYCNLRNAPLPPGVVQQAVWAGEDVRDERPWSSIGGVTDGELHLAMYKWDDVNGDGVEDAEERIYVNPMPYLAAYETAQNVQLPLARRAPEIQELQLEFAADDSFVNSVVTPLLLADGSEVAGTSISGVSRFFFRLKKPGEGDDLQIPPVVPYEIAYEIREVISDDVKAAGVYHFNTLLSEDGLSLENVSERNAGLLYRTANNTAPVSNVSEQDFWIYVPIDNRNLLPAGPIDISAKTAGNNALDFLAETDGVRQFPDGEYELVVSVSDLRSTSETRVNFSVGVVNLAFEQDAITLPWSSSGTYNAVSNLVEGATRSNLTWEISGEQEASIDARTGEISFEGSEPGSYLVTVRHDIFADVFAQFTLDLVALDLQVNAVTEADEEVNGAYIALEAHPDNNIQHDVAELTLTYAGANTGTVTLNILSGDDKMRLWLDRAKTAPAIDLRWDLAAGETVPNKIFVDGIASSAPQEIELQLQYADNPNNVPSPDNAISDNVKMTVVHLAFNRLTDNTVWQRNKTYDAKSRLTADSEQVDALVSWVLTDFPASGAAVNGSGVVSLGSQASAYTITATHNSLPTLSTTLDLNVVWVSDIEIIAINSPLDANPNAAGGLRIYPGQMTPGDATARNVVKIRATIFPAVAGLDVHFKAFDVDDPSSDNNDLDPNGPAGGDNKGAVNGAKQGQLSANSVATNITGIAEVEFTVTQNQADNFRVGAHLNPARLNMITDNNVPANNTRRFVGLPGLYSDLLTVWRKFHLEIDSMDREVNTLIRGSFNGFRVTNPSLAQLTNSNTAFNDASTDLDGPPDDMNNLGFGRFQNGTATLGSTQNVTLPPLLGNGDDFIVISTTSLAGLAFSAQNANSSLNISGTINDVQPNQTSYTWRLNVTSGNNAPVNWQSFVGGSISIDGGRNLLITGSGINQLTTTDFNIPFELADDDTTPILPKAINDISFVETAFAQAYITPVLDGGGNANNNKLNVPFVPNMAALNIPAINALLDLPGAFESEANRANNYWVAYVLIGYQANETKDNDPDAEMTNGGVTPLPVPRASVVFWEQIYDYRREVLTGSPSATIPDEEQMLMNAIAHEIGHQFGIDNHNLRSIMGPIGNNKTRFVDSELAIIKSRVKSPGLRQ